MSMRLRSPAFERGERIQTRYTCEGRNVSPPLIWEEVPAEAKSLALTVVDPDAPSGTWSHWVIYNLPTSVDEIEETFPAGKAIGGTGQQGRNDFGNARYEGPFPPLGASHRYFFRLYALDKELELSAGATRQQLVDRIQGHIVETAEYMGTFSRSA